MSFFLPPDEPELRLFGKTRQIDHPRVVPFPKRPAARRKALRSASGLTLEHASSLTDGWRYEVCWPCTDLAGYSIYMTNGDGAGCEFFTADEILDWLADCDRQGRTYYLTDREPADLYIPSGCELERNRRRSSG